MLISFINVRADYFDIALVSFKFLFNSIPDIREVIFFHCFFSYKMFLTVSLKEFFSSFVLDVVGVSWLSFIFLEPEPRATFGVDFTLTECFIKGISTIRLFLS